jgi:hypothetical protein
MSARSRSAVLVLAVSAAFVLGNAVWSASPRFDGAGYSVLAQALFSGQGYRAIDQPGRPPHAHFPPGYPLFLAAVWRFTGSSLVAAHAASAVCTIAAALVTWLWFRMLLPSRAALASGLALSVNWVWARNGSAILSEPLFLLLSQLTTLAALRARTVSSAGIGHALTLGLLLGASLLTRHAAIGFALAIVLDLGLRGRWAMAVAVAALTGAIIAPWLCWMVAVGQVANTQAGLLVNSDWSLAERFFAPVIFYAQRIPDLIFGPFVEVGSAPGRNLGVVAVANMWALVLTASVFAGWLRLAKDQRRRLAALVPLLSLGILGLWPYTEAGRLLTPLVPFLLIGMVEGVAGLIGWILRRFPSQVQPRQIRFTSACLVLALALPYSCYALATQRARALEASHRDFDAACEWIASRAERPGPVISRHPGEVFWRTGRQGLEVSSAERPGDASLDGAAIARMIDEFGVAYLLVDEGRYLRAPATALGRFVAQNPGRVREVFRGATDRSSVVVYEVVSD